MMNGSQLQINSTDTKSVDKQILDFFKNDSSKESKKVLNMIDDELKKKSKKPLKDAITDGVGTVTSTLKSLSDDFQTSIISKSPVSIKSKVGKKVSINTVFNFTIEGKKYNLPVTFYGTIDLLNKNQGSLMKPNLKDGFEIGKVNLRLVGDIPIKQKGDSDRLKL